MVGKVVQRSANVLQRSPAFKIKRWRTLVSMITFVHVQNFIFGPAFSVDHWRLPAFTQCSSGAIPATAGDFHFLKRHWTLTRKLWCDRAFTKCTWWINLMLLMKFVAVYRRDFGKICPSLCMTSCNIWRHMTKNFKNDWKYRIKHKIKRKFVFFQCKILIYFTREPQNWYFHSWLHQNHCKLHSMK